MLTPFSLRSRHGDVSTLGSLVQIDPAPYRRSGSDRHLPVGLSTPAAVEVRGHRWSDGSPRISLPTRTAEPNGAPTRQVELSGDVTDSRAPGVITSSPVVSQSATDKASSAGTITTRSSQELNSRLTATLSRWNDDVNTNSSDLSARVGQTAVTGDVTTARAQGVTASSPRGSQSISVSSTGDVTDSRAPGVITSSRGVGQTTSETSTAVQTSGTRSTLDVQPSRAQPTRQPHSVSMSDIVNAEAKTSDERTASRPRSTIYGEIRDRVFGSKQSTVGGKPASPFSKFEPLRDETGKKDITGIGRSKPADIVSKETADGAPLMSEPNRSLASEPRVADLRVSSTTPQKKDDFSTVKTTALAVTGQVSSSSPVSGTISSSSSGDPVVNSRGVSASNQLFGHASVTQQTPAAKADDTHQQRDQVTRQGNTGVGRTVTTRAEVRPWTQAHTATERKLDSDIPAKISMPTGRVEVQQIGAALPSSTTSAHTLSLSASPVISTSSVQTSRAKIIPSPTSRVDWAKQRFGGQKSTDAGTAIQASSPKLKDRTFSFPQSNANISEERTSSNLDERTPKSAAVPATRVISSSSSVQERSPALQTPASSAVVLPPSTAVHSPPFKPLTVSPPITISSRVAIVHGLQMSPPASTSAPSTGTEPGRSTWSPALTIHQSVVGKQPDSSVADVRLATRAQTGSGVQSTTSIATSSTSLQPSDWRSPGRPVQPAVGVTASQRPPPAVVSSSAFAASATQSYVSPTSVLPTPVVAAVPSGVSSMPAVSRTHPVSTVLESSTSLPSQTLMSASTFSVETPVVSPVLARPAQPTIKAQVCTPQVPQIQLSAQPLKPVIVMQSPVPESKLIMVAPTISAVSQKSVPDANIPTSASLNREDTSPLYSTLTRREQPSSGVAQTEASKVSSSEPSQVTIAQTQVPSASSSTQVAVTQNQVQRQVPVSQVRIQQVQTPVPAQPSQVGLSQIQASKLAQPGHVAVQQIQVTSSAQPGNQSRTETQRQAQPTRVVAPQMETKSVGVANGAVVTPTTFADTQRDRISQIPGDSRTRQNEGRGGNEAVPGGQLVATSGHRNQVPAQPSQVPNQRGSTDRHLMSSSSVADPQRRGGTAAVDDEVNRALRALDSIAAETRSLSSSLGPTTTLPASTTTTSLRVQTSQASSLGPTTTLPVSTTTTALRVQTSQASTAVVVGSPRDTAPVQHQKTVQQKSPRAETTPLQSARSLDSSGVIKKHLDHLERKSHRAETTPLQSARSVDSSGVIKKHLDHLESMFRPGTGDPHVKKSVQLRKPRPLRKAETVDLTTVGIGVDPELMQLLKTRKEKSASDDEDSAAKPRDDVVDATSRYRTVFDSICTYRIVVTCSVLF